jgi:predicted PurR-regulated permease PerM
MLFLAGLIPSTPSGKRFSCGAYLFIHVIEGETATPMLLARRFTLNPRLVIISIVFWY